MTEQRTLLVTGASSGIGAACARRLAAPGVRLMLHASGRDEHKRAALEALAAELAEGGAQTATCFLDLAEPGAGTALASATLAHFGELDGIVSNAGFADRTPFLNVPRERLDSSFSVMTGLFFDLARAAAPALAASGSGRIVAISSFVAHRFAPDGLFAVTAAAKAGLEALARSLAVELGPQGVTVNCVAPGYTRKEASGHRAIPEAMLAEMASRAPTGRIAEPDDIAAAVAFLMGPDARQITGQTLFVDGGLCLT
ncbi:hypothetical protein SZ64_09815 [Erythrobacter sp. SG61-1L]|uniref:SDR family NAD(P)-dependent oxidoreductase n=1 Tax=Erythrobacter sp. SG61-1L TaxID=1603897 RepID=UPI0006C8EB19|nr:SDR family oxidoreductase [Erythrobacter sp. SG61-1L]KPL68390.1 hypothetical protein SZ64_09815 [Erythrobacter sp. SG61-1L]